MSGKQLARLGLVFLALVLLWGAAALTRRAGGLTGSHDSLTLPAVARNAVDSVTLVKGSDTTVLAKVDSSHWTANGHPASMSAVGELLDALADSTRGSDVVAEQRSSQASLGVDSDSGTRATVRAKGKTVIVISHDDRYYSLGDRIIKLDYGQIEFDRAVTAAQLAEMKVTPHFYPDTVASR